MKQQFTFVKRFAGHDHLFLDSTCFYSDCPDIERTALVDTVLNTTSESKESFLALYCLGDER